MTNNERTAIIRRLNDLLRCHHVGGTIVLTPGIRDMGQGNVAALLAEISTFSNFATDNDPYEEHDCAVLVFAGYRIIWKIDYYDRKMTYASPDPADPEVTERVMCVMIANEY
jgi:hypothetical protein